MKRILDAHALMVFLEKGQLKAKSKSCGSYLNKTEN